MTVTCRVLCSSAQWSELTRIELVTAAPGAAALHWDCRGHNASPPFPGCFQVWVRAYCSSESLQLGSIHRQTKQEGKINVCVPGDRWTDRQTQTRACTHAHRENVAEWSRNASCIRSYVSQAWIERKVRLDDSRSWKENVFGKMGSPMEKQATAGWDRKRHDQSRHSPIAVAWQPMCIKVTKEIR